MAFVERESSGLLWLFDLERHTHRALSDRGLASSPRWSPDGTRLVASWTEAGPFHLWLLPTTGGEWEQLTGGAAFDWTPSWSPDGRLLAFLRGSVSPDILLYRLEDRRVVPFLDTPARELWPDFSPDGRWLAYGSDETGRFEVYVTSVPDRQRTFAVSHEGGGAPAWSRDGRRLFYLSLPSADGRQSMMSVTVRDGATLSLGRPTLLCRLPEGFVFLGPMRSYALHPDGKRFVVGRRVQAQPTPPITRLTLVENWSAELDRLAPPAR
jgi:Tol biopolymer transport system component